jgi:hypothetical protein
MRGQNLRFAVRVVLIVTGLSLPGRIHAQPEPFRFPVVVTDKDVGEPGIDVAPDGTLYINAPVQLQAGPAPSLLFRSDDCGDDWAITSPAFLRGNLPGGADSDVAIDPSDGTIYYEDLYTVDSTFSISRDKGFTWVFSDPVAGLPLQDRPWLASSGRGVVYEAYTQLILGIAVTKWVLQGQLSLLTTLAADSLLAGACTSCPPGTVVTERGLDSDILGLMDKVGVIYPTTAGGMRFAGSTNGGLTWSQFTVSPNTPGVDTTHSIPNVANDGSGTLHAVWLEVLPAGSPQCGLGVGCSRVQYSRSADFGQTWIPPTTLVVDGTSVFPWVDARDSKVSVALYHTNAVATPDTVPGDSRWLPKYVESLDGGNTWSELVPVSLGSAKTGPVCTAGSSCVSDRELLDFLQVAIDLQGRANVTWTRVISQGQPGIPKDTEILFARQLGSFQCP